MNNVLEDMLRDFPEPFDYQYRLSADAILDEFVELLGHSYFLNESDMDRLCSMVFAIPHFLEYYRQNYLLGPMGYKDTLIQSLAHLEDTGDLESLVRSLHRQSEIIKDISFKLSKFEKLEKTADSLRVDNARLRDRNNLLISEIHKLKDLIKNGKKIKTKN